VAALSLALAACHGGSTGTSSYVPAGSSALQSGPAGIIVGPDVLSGDIDSNCGKRIHIVVAGIIDCKFDEKGYGNRTFTLTDHTNGLILISPTSGNRHTVFRSPASWWEAVTLVSWQRGKPP
jgi:hypothetical protein